MRISQKTFPILSDNLGVLEDALAGGEEFRLLPKPADWQPEGASDVFEMRLSVESIAEMLRLDYRNHSLRTMLTDTELARSTETLYRSGKQAMEENGANTLYLALGTLRWYETPASQKRLYAPLVLLPVDLIRMSAQKGFVIRLRDDETQMNITLLELPRTRFNLEIKGLDPLPTDDSGVDLVKIFTIIRHAVMPSCSTPAGTSSKTRI